MCDWKAGVFAPALSFFGSVFSCFNELRAIDRLLISVSLRILLSIGWLLLFVAIMAEYQGAYYFYAVPL